MLITSIPLMIYRHCLWILGNERTLTRSESVWETLVLDAKNRKCFFDADEDKDLAKAILEFKSESDKLLKVGSILIRNQRWKVWRFMSYNNPDMGTYISFVRIYHRYKYFMSWILTHPSYFGFLVQVGFRFLNLSG